MAVQLDWTPVGNPPLDEAPHWGSVCPRGVVPTAFYEFHDPNHPWRRLGWYRDADGMWRNPTQPERLFGDGDPGPAAELLTPQVCITCVEQRCGTR
jgi:hypothetical protein